MPQNLTKSKKGELTRQRILEVAAPLFNQRGFAGCSIHDVLEATGLEKGGLYRHFASKEELAAECFRFMLESSVKLRTEHLADIPGAVAKLREVVDRFVNVPSPVKGGCPLLNTAIDADDGNPLLRELCRQGIEAWKARIGLIVEAGTASGELRRDIQPRRIANSIVSTLEGALMISRIEGTPIALEDARDSLHNLIASLDATSPSSPPRPAPPA